MSADNLHENDQSRNLPYLNGNGWKDTLKLSGNSFYQFLRDCYYGQGGFASGQYLIPFPNEHSKKFENRKKKREITNHYQIIIDSLLNPIFKNEVVRDGLNNFQESFMMDATGQGDTLSGVVKSAGLNQEIYGVSFLLVDNFIEIPDSEGEQLSSRRFPFVTEILPAMINEFEIDENGTLTKFSYYKNAGETGSADNLCWDEEFDKKGSLVTWTQDEIQINSDTPVLNSLGYIPVVRVTTNTSKKFIPWPHNYALATEQLRIFNLNSDIAEIEDNQGHAIFYGQFGDANAISNSPANFLNIPTDAKMPPGYASAPAQNLQTMTKNRAERVQDMYAMAGMPMPSAYAVSGEAKKMDMLRFHQRVSNLRSCLEDAEIQIWGIFADYFQARFDTPFLQYSKEFGINDLDSEANFLQDVSAVGLPVEVRRKLTENLVRMKLGKISDDISNELTSQFDRWEEKIRNDEAPI